MKRHKSTYPPQLLPLDALPLAPLHLGASVQRTIVAGCGRLGSQLASELSQRGMDVVVIDLQESAFRSLLPEFGGFQLVGNAAEFEVLKQANIEQADSLLAVTGEDNLNLMIAQSAQIVFGVKTVLARVIDPLREAVYRDLGVATISPTPLVTQAFLRQLAQQQANGCANSFSIEESSSGALDQ